MKKVLKNQDCIHTIGSNLYSPNRKKNKLPYIIIMLALFCIVLTTVSANAQIFKWKDSTGHWHFGHQPADSADVEAIGEIENTDPVYVNPKETKRLDVETKKNKKIQALSHQLKITSCDFRFEASKFPHIFEWIIVSYTIYNGYDKTIKYLDASIHFCDKLEKSLVALEVKRDSTIYSKTRESNEGAYKFYYTHHDEAIFKRLPASEIISKIYVKKIVFSDDSILTVNSY